MLTNSSLEVKSQRRKIIADEYFQPDIYNMPLLLSEHYMSEESRSSKLRADPLVNLFLAP